MGVGGASQMLQERFPGGTPTPSAAPGTEILRCFGCKPGDAGGIQGDTVPTRQACALGRVCSGSPSRADFSG